MLASLVDRAHLLSSEVFTPKQEVDHLEILSLIINFYMALRKGEAPRPEDLEELAVKIRSLEEVVRGS